VILIIYAGLTIASMARVTNDNVYDDYYDPDCPDCDNANDPRPAMFIIFFASLFCTVGSLLCGIPLIIAQFISTKVINNNTFQALVSLIGYIYQILGYQV